MAFMAVALWFLNLKGEEPSPNRPERELRRLDSHN